MVTFITSYLYAIAALVAGLCGWVVASWLGQARTEAWLLGFLVFAYIVGNSPLRIGADAGVGGVRLRRRRFRFRCRRTYQSQCRHH